MLVNASFLTCFYFVEVLKSNGFCLANTETILFDLTPPIHLSIHSDELSGRR